MLTNDIINNLCQGKNPDDPVSVDELKHALRLVLEEIYSPPEAEFETDPPSEPEPEDLTEAEIEKLTNPDTEETDEDETDG